MIDTAITTLLKANAGVGDRVYSGGEVVEVTRDLPKVVYTFIPAGSRLYTDDGNAGLVKGRYQLDVFAARPSAARAIADTIRVALDGYSGTSDGTKIDRIYFPDGEQMQKAEQPVGQSATAARYTQDMLVDYRERIT
jgi:hypothetical protein